MIHYLRELFYDRNPGDAPVKVGSDREFVSSPNSAKLRIRGDRGLLYTLLRGGTLQNWPCYKGIYSHKFPRNTVGFSVEIVLILAI